MYNLISARTIGSSHLNNNLPCQDYGMVKELDNDCKVFAVSDGHGDPKCFRSDRGSKFITEIAVDILPHFVDTVVRDNGLSLLYGMDKNLLRQLSTSIIGNWLCRIDEDIAEDPITPETISTFEKQTGKHISSASASEYIQNIRVERAYGCTLLAGIQTEDFLFLLHHGDGRCVVIDGNGDAHQPVPWDKRCVGSMTTSCCDKDAIESIRYSFIDLKKNKVIACFLSSDGVEDSFASIDAMYSYFFENIKYAVNNGTKKLEEYLSETLPGLSAKGSADDITICGIIDVDECSSHIKKFDEFSKKVELVVSLGKAEDKIQSILNGGLFAHLKREYEKANSEYLAINEEYVRLCNTRDELERKLIKKNEQLGQSKNINYTTLNDLLISLQDLYESLKDSFLGTSLKKCVEELKSVLTKIEKLKQEKDLIEKRLDEAKKAFDKINNEYIGYLNMKRDIEKQMSEAKDS